MHTRTQPEPHGIRRQADPAPGFVSLPVRLPPGADLRRALEQVLAEHGAEAGFVLAGIDSLRPALIRLAGAEETLCLDEDLEVLTLSGSLAPTGSHLHLSVSLCDGRVLGGHAAYGCTVRTTAEVLVALLPRWRFSREPDARTGYDELVVRPSSG
jgi:predicted DNA-binding protein with PD1-like motif